MESNVECKCIQDTVAEQARHQSTDASAKDPEVQEAAVKKVDDQISAVDPEGQPSTREESQKTQAQVPLHNLVLMEGQARARAGLAGLAGGPHAQRSLALDSHVYVLCSNGCMALPFCSDMAS